MSLQKTDQKGEEMKARFQRTLRAELAALEKLALELPGQVGFWAAVETLRLRSGKIVVTGVGKSSFIGMKLSATLTSLGQSAFFLHPVEALHGDTGMVSDGDVVIAFSHSGESPEVVKIARYLKKSFSLKLIAITGQADSALGRMSDAVVSFQIAEEGCPLDLAPMASTTVSLVIGDLLASAITSPEDFKRQNFAKFHPGGKLGLSLTLVHERMATGEACPTVQPRASIREALQKMTDKRLGVIAVTDTMAGAIAGTSTGTMKDSAAAGSAPGTLLGVVTDGDIRRYLLKHDTIHSAPVTDLMTRTPKTIARDATLAEALIKMEQYKITSLFVLSVDHRLEGILHIHDVLEQDAR